MPLAINSHLVCYVYPSPSSASYPFSASFSAAAIRAKLSLAKSICFWGMVIDSVLEPLRGFQAQSIVSVFIQTGLYAESTVHLKFFLVSQPKYVRSTFWSLVLGRQYSTSI